MIVIVYQRQGSNRSVKTDNNQISIDNLSIGKNEGVRVEYTVSLKQEYWDGQFHPANGTTYLQNNKLSPAQYLHFAVPSIKYDTFNLPVQKFGMIKITSIKRDKILSYNYNLL
ncbi:MAG: hypothetical protein ACLT64_08285 [Streptococcus salivarius]